jgi:large subunit ribosomal protein L23
MANKTLVKYPHLTEKASILSENNQYVFVVAKEATASEVKKVITETYKVKVDGVRMINTKSKLKRIGRGMGVKPGIRKAIVTLKKGEKIDILTA